MRIETDRAFLCPYTPEQLELALRHPKEAARQIGADYGTLEKDILDFQHDIYLMKLKLIEKNPNAWLFATYWQIVLKRSGAIAGEVGYKGLCPDGEIEIGYNTRPEHRCRGLMTEAVKSMCGFAFTQQSFDIKKISATTRPENLASRRVLEKCGFKQNGTLLGYIYWELFPNTEIETEAAPKGTACYE
jgi:RimJ/RimL family protein N-acetyltransferase